MAVDVHLLSPLLEKFLLGAEPVLLVLAGFTTADLIQLERPLSDLAV